MFLLCAVLLLYASCDPKMYCILQKKKRRCQCEAEREMHLPRRSHTEQCFSGLCSDSTWKKKKKQNPKLLHCHRVVSFFPTKTTVRNAFGPCLLLLQGLYLELQSKPSVKCLLVLDHWSLSKGALCSFVEEIQMPNFNTYNINEVIIQTQKYSLFPLLNKQAVLRGK